MLDIPIQKKFWNLIVKGIKTKEVRKLTKGIPSGKHRFVSIEFDCKCGLINKYGIGIHKKTGVKSCYWCGNEKFTRKEIFGTAHLKFLCNPSLEIFDGQHPSEDQIGFEFDEIEGEVDWETVKFVVENYVDKHDFVVYEISDVKVGE